MNTQLDASLQAQLDLILTEQVVFDAIVQARGNSALASEQILGAANFEYSSKAIDYIRSKIPALLVPRMSELKQHMEAISTLELFEFMPLLHQSLKASLTSLEPGEAVTAYMKLMELIGKKTEANELNININDRRFNQLPRNIQQLFVKLEASGQLEEVVGPTVEGEFRQLPAVTQTMDSD